MIVITSEQTEIVGFFYFYLTAPDSTLSNRGDIHHEGRGGKKGKGTSTCSQRSPTYLQASQTAHLAQSVQKRLSRLPTKCAAHMNTPHAY